MEAKHLLSINPYPLTPEEFRQEIIAGLLIALKKPFSGETGSRGEGVTAFEEEEATGYYFLIDLLQKLLADAGSIPEQPNPEG